MDKRPLLKFDKKTANELDNAFVGLYPLLYHELKRIMTELPQRSAAAAEFEQYVRKKCKEQEVCKHEYGKPTYTFIWLWETMSHMRLYTNIKSTRYTR